MKSSLVSSSAVLLFLLGSQTSATVPCTSSQLAAPPVVEDTAGALQLAAAVNCSGGSFDVEWAGSVVVEETIRLLGGTTLSITGAVDGTSVVNGATRTSLFEVEGGTLHLYHLTLVNGTGERGGAIFATDATLTAAGCTILHNTGALGGGVFLDNTVLETANSSFAQNTASGSGGAMHVEASNVTVGANVLFENNEASSGGALFVAGRSIVTLVGDNISFAKNSAAVYGGGLYVYKSAANVTGKVECFGNTAEFGGAVAADNGSVSVIGDMLLSNNVANDSGGAFYSGTSDIDIAGTTVWENNSAVIGGGGLTMRDTIMHVQASGEASFIGNTAEYGGAAYMSTSTLIVDGGVRFSENTAGLNGGALYSDLSMINISGGALWENNRSPAGGGGLLMWTSDMHVQRSGTVAFIGNAANVGGAAYIDHGMLLTYGDVSFFANIAESNGGALCVSIAVVDIAGSALWENNTAGQRGGAVEALQSDVVLQSSGKGDFVNNTAANFGGAAYVSNSSLLFDGDVVFAENVAEKQSGGALYIDLSDMAITGTAVWKDNSAPSEGGGLLMWNSTLHVSSSGTAECFGNDANSGGAMYLHNSTLLFDGDVLFANNLVHDLGGGLFIDHSSVNVTGTTAWENNTSLINGGGMAMLESTLHIVAGGNVSFSNNTANVGGGMYVGEHAAVVITGLATFSRNSAATGAGIKLASFSTANFAGGLVVIRGNIASANGGGMHCESPTLLSLDGVQFESNYAGVSGGGIKTLLAGTERVANTEAKPAIISNCSFSNNTAGDTGGAFFIAGGFVDITGSHFSNNIAARSGGAMLASGIVTLDHCAFVGNQAGVGSAVTNAVSVTFYSVDFINNTLLCDDIGLFLNWNDTSSFAVACASCAGDCFNCTVENPNRVQECHSVLEHTTSLDENGALESLTLQNGFWRSSPTSKDIRECYESSACVGGKEEYCNEGYEGPLCAVCADGYTAGLGYACSECNDERRSVTITIVVVLLAASVATVARKLKSLGSDAELKAAVEGFSGDIGEGRSRFACAKASQALKIIVVSWQIITQFSMVASVVYPDVYNTFLKYADVVNLNLGWMVSAGCLVDTDFYDNLLVSTVVPLLVVSVVAVSHRVASSRHSAIDRQTRTRIDRRHASVLFWVSFLVYATVSSAIFQTFACDDFDTGTSYLRVDHSLECYTPEHTMFMVYAGVMGVIYPFGIPFCYAVVLYRRRAALKDKVARETSTTDVTVLKELWGAYRPEVYFYEVVECVRRVVLSGVIVFIFPNTAGQIATAFLLALFFAALFMALDPYTSGFDTLVARTGHMVVLMSMFVALLQKVDMGDDDDFSQNVFAIVLVLANCGMVVAAAGEACGMCFVAVQEIRQPVQSLRKTAPHEHPTVALTEEDEIAPF